MSEFTRTIEFQPAFDKRDPDPRKNYGVHGAEMTWLVTRKNRAIQFVVYTNWQLPHVQAEQDAKGVTSIIYRPMPADLGYHSPVPMYEGQKPMKSDCPRTGGVCYYDGSGLRAKDVFKILVEQGGEAVWVFLENVWRERFEAET